MPDFNNHRPDDADARKHEVEALTAKRARHSLRDELSIRALDLLGRALRAVNRCYRLLKGAK